MKNKKLLLPAVILVVAVLAIAAFSVISSIAKKPTVTSGEFPFSITYELDGQTVTINDVYKVRYDGNDGYADSKSRVWVGEIGNMGEGNTLYTLKQNGNSRIELSTNFYADYLMDDAEYDYFEVFEPQLYYYDAEENEYTDEETLLAQGVKLISFEYPAPIQNTLVFSHISYFSGAVVTPTVFIALLAIIAVIAFVKKENELQYQGVDKVSTILNFIVGFVVLPFATLAASLIDINGGHPEFYYQIFYFIPAFIALCVAASVILRRKGYGKPALYTCLAGPAVFIVYLMVCGACGLL